MEPSVLVVVPHLSKGVEKKGVPAEQIFGGSGGLKSSSAEGPPYSGNPEESQASGRPTLRVRAQSRSKNFMSPQVTEKEITLVAGIMSIIELVGRHGRYRLGKSEEKQMWESLRLLGMAEIWEKEPFLWLRTMAGRTRDGNLREQEPAFTQLEAEHFVACDIVLPRNRG